jgi:hypothetical protein
MKNVNYEGALGLKVDGDDAGTNLTIREYLRELLLTLWMEEEGFSGKRPFGNSGWQHDVYAPLVKAGFIKGTVDEEWNNVDVADEEKASKFVQKLIEYVL